MLDTAELLISEWDIMYILFSLWREICFFEKLRLSIIETNLINT